DTRADLTACLTAALDGHILECPEGGHREMADDSCGDRHCSKSHGTAAARRLEARAVDLLDVPNLHIVSTPPRALDPIALADLREVYGLMMRAVEPCCRARMLLCGTGFR